MNDKERKLWIDNDEGLYLAWKGSGLSQARWMNENRQLVDEHIAHALGRSVKSIGRRRITNPTGARPLY